MGEKILDFELVIIGGGPAGIKAGEEAKSLGINYVILERGGIAAAWQTLRPEMVMLSPCHPQRDWTSLTKNFPIWRLDVKRPFCTAEEFVNYLKEYSASFNANIKVRTEVKSVMKDKHLFKIVTSDDTYCAPLVLVTTGFLSNPFIPDIPGFRQQEYVMHSHDFRGAKSFRSKRVIVIGGGNSAAETALALCGEAQTYLFTRNKLKFFSKTKNLCHIRGISESLLLEMIQMELIRYLPDSK
jgi:putative flavoprotein involved in K+ transport